MPKTPDSGPGGPLDVNPDGAENGASERRGPNRAPAEARAAAPEARAAAPAASPATPESGTAAAGGKQIGERKKQFLIAPRHPEGLAPLGLSPLSLSTVEQALRNSPDIDVVDTVGPKNVVGALANGMGGSQGILVARMTEQKAGVLHQQGQGRLLVERDQHLGLMDASHLQPSFVTSVTPSSGPALTAVIKVVSKDGAPVANAEVSLFGSMLPATAATDASGQVTLSLFGETASSVRSLYVKPKSDYWSFYQRDPDISPDEPNVVTLRALADWPSLAGFPQQKTVGWGQKAMRMDQLPATYRGQGIKIAVIDSGIATTHEELRRVHNGFDIVNKKTSPDTWNDDTLGHGSHCAGVIGGAELAYGIRGFAPDAELHACKLFPGGQVSQLIDALEYCIEHQIDVVNLSLGGAEVSEALEQQIQRARRAGIACIVAAGNSGGPVQYPASSPNVLAVAAIGKLDEFPPDSYHAQTLTQNVDAGGYFTASFSCYGPQVAVCGPGVAIASSVPPNNYAAWDGTSMAAPHITGLAALVLAHHPEFQTVFQARNADRVERLFQLIRMSARRVSLADPSRVGLGLPDAVLAVGLQQQTVPANLGAMLPGQQGYGIPLPQPFALPGMFAMPPGFAYRPW
ncbi:S8 family serine peptidase [Massilia sp. CF038]|uniref:S8 family serine peptidase n=1 Tax=Massilia sp. CF038 TaxID=1881045 RepID=UPI000922555B|nr:S8 family serine peptidase [Massilia sp. CF038]SHG59538.1 Subtilase family protein [Massilia sp. CF038]